MIISYLKLVCYLVSSLATAYVLEYANKKDNWQRTLTFLGMLVCILPNAAKLIDLYNFFVCQVILLNLLFTANCNIHEYHIATSVYCIVNMLSFLFSIISLRTIKINPVFYSPISDDASFSSFIKLILKRFGA